MHMLDEDLQKTTNTSEQPILTWEADEYIHYDKDASWFAIFALGALVFSGLLFIYTDWVNAAAIFILSMVTIYFARLKPRRLDYQLKKGRLMAGTKEYVFSDFQSFSLLEENGVESIYLLPRKRFSPALSLYVAHDIQEQVMDEISKFIPFERHEPDFVDRMLTRFRF